MPICKMCGQDRKLIQAHIIPRSFWNNQMRGDEPLAILTNKPGWKPIKSPIGEYDSNILCEQCDNQLGVFDQHAYENLVLDSGTPFGHQGKTLGFSYPKADSTLIRKFITSVVWRASISGRNYFNRIRLGKYEDVFKEYFLGDDNIGLSISCLMAEFDRGDVPFLNPQYSRMEGIKFAVVFANRFTFYAKVDQQPLPDVFKQSEIKQGSLVTSIMREWETSHQKRAMLELVHQNPKPGFWKK